MCTPTNINGKQSDCYFFPLKKKWVSFKNSIYKAFGISYFRWIGGECHNVNSVNSFNKKMLTNCFVSIHVHLPVCFDWCSEFLRVCVHVQEFGKEPKHLQYSLSQKPGRSQIPSLKYCLSPSLGRISHNVNSVNSFNKKNVD